MDDVDMLILPHLDDLVEESDDSQEVVSRLLSIKHDGGKWWIFHGEILKTKEQFRESGKLWYLGDAMRKSGLDISRWDNGGFGEVVQKCIEFQVEVVWT